MSDDLNLLLLLIIDNTLVKVAIHIEHGLNNFNDYEYFREKDVIEKYNELLPEHLKPYIIVGVEQLQYIVCTTTATSLELENSFVSKNNIEFTPCFIIPGIEETKKALDDLVK